MILMQQQIDTLKKRDIANMRKELERKIEDGAIKMKNTIDKKIKKYDEEA